MLSETPKTLFESILICWAIMFVVALAVRCRALHGRLSLSGLQREFFSGLLRYVGSTIRTMRSWFPVLGLILFAGSVADFGLLAVAEIMVIGTLIAQWWRYDFPCVPLIGAVLGWDNITIIQHQVLILPITVRLKLIASFWGASLGCFLIITPILTPMIGPLLLATAFILETFTLSSALSIALSLEREADRNK